MEKQVIKTKKGIFVRIDNEFGAIVFSPYSGLFFAIANEYVNELLRYCNEQNHTLPDNIIRDLSIGINPQSEKNFEIPSHWLPNQEAFSYLNEDSFSNKPIVINWLISNKCCFKCNYCYAGDINDKPVEMADAKVVAQNILSLNPLAVVFSGGEPLREKQRIIDALNILGNKVGIIVDTNGYHYDEELAKLFKKYNVVVRVSLDSLHNETNSKIRPLKHKESNANVLNQILTNIAMYKDKKIPILIHTVVSSVNKNNLDDLYEKLPLLGVNGWRIFSVINPNDKENKEQFEKVMTYGRMKSVDEAQEDVQNKIALFSKRHISKSNFSLQIVHMNENKKNSVILVLPSGKFVTESRLKREKIEIVPKSIFDKVDLIGHYERYLGTFNIQ